MSWKSIYCYEYINSQKVTKCMRNIFIAAKGLPHNPFKLSNKPKVHFTTTRFYYDIQWTAENELWYQWNFNGSE